MPVQTHASLDTVYNSDSVEWCPTLGYQDLMLCGTYQLQETNQQVQERVSDENVTQTRLGRLYMYSLQDQSGDLSLQQKTSLDMPGILDIKWSYVSASGCPMFALVNAIGQLQVYTVTEQKTVAMVSETQLQEQCLGLSLEWDNMTTSSPGLARIVSSDSSGRVHVHQLCEAGLDSLHTWKAHDYEAWICAFNQADTSTVYTGGDDCRLKGWDLRADLNTPIFASKRHTMGVCSIQSNSVKPHILATGSYDEHVLLWDTRLMRQPTGELRVGGGVWRVKWEPQHADFLLTATMYNGFHVIHTASAMKEVCHYTEHDSIGYGADWCRLSLGDLQATPTPPSMPSADTNQPCSVQDCQREPADIAAGEICKSDGPRTCLNQSDKRKSYIVATSSFYDHLLKLWTLNT